MRASTSRSLWMNRAAMTFLFPEARVIGEVAALRSGGLKGSNVILSPGVSWDCDLRRRVEDSVVDGMRAA